MKLPDTPLVVMTDNEDISWPNNLNRPNEKSVRLLNRERLAESLLGQYHVPQAYRSLLLADLHKAEPTSVDKFIERSIRHS